MEKHQRWYCGLVNLCKNKNYQYKVEYMSGFEGIQLFGGCGVSKSWVTAQLEALNILTSGLEVSGGAIHNNSIFTSLNKHSFDDLSVINITTQNLIGGYASFDAYPTLNSDVAIHHFHGYQSRLTQTGAGDTVGGVFNYTASYVYTGSGTITSYAGIKIGSPSLTGGGHITHALGLWINPITQGNINKAIMTEGGGIEFGGLLNNSSGGLKLKGLLYCNQTFFTENANADNRNYGWILNGTGYGFFDLYQSNSRGGDPFSAGGKVLSVDKERRIVFYEAKTAPSINPVGAAILYVDPADGAMKVRGKNGTITTIALA